MLQEKDGQLRHYAAMVVQGTLAAILLEGPTLPSQKTVRRQLVEFWQGRKPVHHLVRPKSEDQINGRLEEMRRKFNLKDKYLIIKVL